VREGTRGRVARGYFVGAPSEQEVFGKTVNAALPTQMHAVWYATEVIPLTANGKVNTAALVRPTSAATPSGPRDPRETENYNLVLDILAEICPHRELQEQIDLTLQGVVSRDINALETLLRRRTGRKDLGRGFVLQHPTVNKLVAFLSSTSVPLAPAPIPNQAPTNERIAIVGMAMRGPGSAVDCDAFRTMLKSGTHAFSRMPKGRMDVTKLEGRITSGAYMCDIHQFDHLLFSISEAEALNMDPQHRHFLQVAYMALRDASFDPFQMTDHRVGVFVGQMNYDHFEAALHPLPMAGTGHYPALLAARVHG
jgi:hypothetical protein